VDDQGHVSALAELEARAPTGVQRSFTTGFSWGKVVAALAIVVLLGYGAYRLMWPASYLGAVLWDEGYTTLTLVETGVKLDVSDFTVIQSRSGDDVTLQFLRALPSGSQAAPFSARVIYRPYLRLRGSGETQGRAQSIAAR